MADQSLGVVLVVDDDEAKRYTIAHVLRKAGFKVVEVGSGAEALRFAETKPLIIILDVQLPDIDGIEVCKRIKANPATAMIPVLHMSSTFVDSDAKVLGLDSGADAYLTDVVNPMELVATVRALLRVRQAEEALRKSEDRFRLLVENVQDHAIYMLDASARITSWNEGVERILGYHEDEFIGQHAFLIFTDEDIREGEAQGEIDTATAKGRAEDERWHVRKDGSRFFATGSLTALHNDRSELIGFAKIMRDITERTRAEEERAMLLAREQAARHEAEEANRLKDDFLATLSHELRTPLMSILGWAELLRSGHLKAEQTENAVNIIDRNAKAQAQLIDDLLDISRIISGKLRLDVQQVQLVSVIDAAIDSVQPAAEARQIRLQRIFDPNAGPVMGDANRLQQVVWNLLSNAIKFTPRGGRVQVRLEAINSHVEISVADTGQGIDPEFLPFIFERFRQADPSTKRSHGGLGLGLAIVRHLIELHGGTVAAHSAGPTKGSIFTVRLPVSIVVQPPPEENQRVHPRAPTSSNFDCPPELDGIRVLIVDDEPDARELLRTILQTCKAHVTTAASSSEGVTAFQESTPDVIISDIGMPGEDGYDFIRKIRALETSNAARIPAVALTAFARNEDRRRALLAGFQIHVAKPVEPAELVIVVANLAGRTPP